MYRDAIPTQSVFKLLLQTLYTVRKQEIHLMEEELEHRLGPGANPMHGRDTRGAVASLASVS